MKKLMILAAVLSAVALTQAEETEQQQKGPRGPKGPITEEQFIAHGQARATEQGVEFDEAAAQAKFAELDADGNGELSREETPKRQGRKGQGEEESSEAPAE